MKTRRNGFTLPEVMVALFVGAFALAAVATLLIVTVRAWRDVTAKWYMTENARLCREKILRGPDGIHGLRESTRNIEILADVDSKMHYDVISSNRQPEMCFLYTVNGTKELKFKTQHTQHQWLRLLKGDMWTDRARVAYDAQQHRLTYVVTNWYVIGGLTNRHVQTLRVPVINE